MRHLQYIGAQVEAAGQQRRLRRRLDITGEQDPHAVHGGEQHETCVVRPGAFARANAGRIAGAARTRRPGPRLARPDHLEPSGPEREDRTSRPHPDRNPGRIRQAPYLGGSRSRLGQRAHQDLADRSPGQHTD